MRKEMKRLYIAYGSNLNREQMAFRCPGARPICKSWLKDHRLVFQGSPAGAHANVIPEKGCQVPVAVWEIDIFDEIALDRYEGVAGGYYTKETMTVDVQGKKKEALIYIMTPHGYGLPTYGYLATIVGGYADFKLPADKLNEAVRFSKRQIA